MHEDAVLGSQLRRIWAGQRCFKDLLLLLLNFAPQYDGILDLDFLFCNLWAVCSDGSAYFRMGISEQVPIGNRWMHIVKPERDHLVKIAAGKYAVWALGSTGSCMLRLYVPVLIVVV